MAEASIPVDLFNPGQVFACLGFLEAADTLRGGTAGGFDWRDPTAVRFLLRARGQENPFSIVLDFFARARVYSLAPEVSDNNTAKWNVPTTRVVSDDPIPFADPPSPAALPAVLELADKSARLTIDHWGDTTRRRDAVKFWAGSGGYPGAALVRDALNLVRDVCRDAVDDPFNLSIGQTSSFRFDWRRDYVPIDAGFSLNEHGDIVTTGYPLVELLAALGLSHARPMRVDRLEYRYAVATGPAGGLLDPLFLRAALGCAALPLPRRSFRMLLAWPGKENQARCITTVTEESSA